MTTQPIIANHVDRGARDEAKLYIAEKTMKLAENKGNENLLLAAWTTARTKGNPHTEKESCRPSLLARNLETREV